MAPSCSWTKTALECSEQTLGALVGLCSLQARETTPSMEGHLILQNTDLQQQPLCGQEGHQVPPWAPQRVRKLASSRKRTIFKGKGAPQVGAAQMPADHGHQPGGVARQDWDSTRGGLNELLRASPQAHRTSGTSG